MNLTDPQSWPLGPLAAAGAATRCAAAVQRILPELREFRHDLHRHPELAFQEERTSARVLEELRKLPGLQIREGIGKTGIVATLPGREDADGPCVALRGDMDALPIRETTGAPYSSVHDGLMHACGHDGHTTCLLGAARVLHEVRDLLHGPVKFIFQPAEERYGGADMMCREGALSDPEPAAIFALHGAPPLPRGKIGCRTGPVMASNDSLYLTLKGRGGHAAQPDSTLDPVPLAAQVITALQTVVSRRTDPLDSVVLSITRMQASDASNIIPDKVELAGTLRTLADRTRHEAIAHIRQIVDGLAAAWGADAELEVKDPYPVTVNHPAAASFVEAMTPEGDYFDVPPQMTAEDFSFYGAHVPAAFWLLGLAQTGENFPGLHTPQFDFPDDMIAPAVMMHCRLALEFSQRWDLILHPR